MSASNCFFVFDDDEWIYVCDPHLYPVGKTPSIFLCMFRKLKHYKKSGEEGPRAVGARSAAHGEGFCCVLTLFEYFKRYPGKRGTLVLTAHGLVGVPWPDVRLVCHLTATEPGLDPLRFVPPLVRVGWRWDAGTR